MRNTENGELKPGDYVTAIIRSSDGKAKGLGGYMYLAEAAGFFILAEFSKSYNGIREALGWEKLMTAVYGCCTLRIIPSGDCYTDKTDAEQVVGKELGRLEERLAALYREEEPGLLEDE